MKFHKCIPPIFSSFRYKLLLAFLIATMVPLISLTFISYHISYNIARDRIIDSAVMTDKQLVSQLNDRLGQVENVADTIQFQMYSLNQPSSNKVDALKKFTTVKNNISLYKSTFDFFHIYVFLQPDQLGSKESLYFFSTDELSAYGLDKNIVSGSGFSSVWIPVSNMPLPKILSTKKSSADVILCVRALKNQATGILEYAYGIALDTSELTTYLQPAALDSRIYSYILTDHGEIAAKNTSSLNLSGISKAQFQKLKGNADSSFHSGDKYYNCCTLSNGWLHVTEIPESYIQGNTHILIRALLITVLIFLLLTVIIVILFSENLTRKITALSYAMEAFQLGYDPEHLSIVTVPHPDDPSRYDEIDRLGITFEDMQHTIAGNLKSIVNLSVNEERLKYQLLQSQINPQMNDTHPTVAVAELMRILIDEEGLGWDQAWDITTKCCAYTNHTIMSEALEKWPIELFSRLLPRVYQIIEEINRRFILEIQQKYPGNFEKIKKMAIIYDGQVKMAHLAIVAGYSVNGVARLHTEILKNQELKDFYEMMPEKFNNKTNGITQRRSCSTQIHSLQTGLQSISDRTGSQTFRS